MSTIITRLDPEVLNSILVSVTVFITISLIFKIKRAYSFFSSRNIDGPIPIPLFGHFHKFLFVDTGLELSKLARKYGNFYGLYLGLSPRLVIADAETMRQICIKDFDVFTDHHGFQLLNIYQQNFIFLQKGNTWRRNRIFMSPTFTSGKIRQMYRLMDSCSLDLIDILREQLVDSNGNYLKDGRIINSKDMFSMYTLDAIANCCYGLKLDRAKGLYSVEENSSRNQFVTLCKNVFEFNKLRLFPELFAPTKLMKSLGFTVIPLSSLEPIAQIARRMLEARKNATSADNSNEKSRTFDDYLQMSINANIDDRMELSNLDSAENHHADLSYDSLRNDHEKLIDTVNSPENHKYNGKKLLEIEIISNAMMLLFVGLETSSSLLSSCVYALSFHPDIQDKLFEEVGKIAQYELDANGNKKFKFDYDSITTCKYLDAVISETLRYSPVFPMVDRFANRDYHFEKWNFSIPKGSVIFLAIYALHHNPEYWPEPAKFDPERFMPENKAKIVPGSYCPFGLGPRHCVGMRFGLTESKLALARVIMDFRFSPAPGMKFPGSRVKGFTPGGLRDPRVILIQRASE